MKNNMNISLTTASDISGISYQSLLKLSKSGELLTHVSNGIIHTKKDYFNYWLNKFEENDK